ncbi:hypothetical protein [Paenibacillus tianjinensis]|uniref:Uncharacterized protein n=1 Tax=Paenibacillus tianjinensis TaxID=2810347 RepID=A0ABX7L699_9BACL|nr:hypothetical protein [Paenibacillus tianjinensis]QSF43447.1 hypothetical protein JRJ22_19480 [Paenibacillus tianjinensis]
MSEHASTGLKEEVGTIVDKLLKNEDRPNTEVLIYFDAEEGKWSITRDRRFFSYGLKVEDKLAHLEKLISMCYGQLVRTDDMTNIYNIKGILKDVAWELNDGMLKYKNNEIEWS